MRKIICLFLYVFSLILICLLSFNLPNNLEKNKTFYYLSNSSNAIISSFNNENSLILNTVLLKGQSVCLDKDTDAINKIIKDYNGVKVFDERGEQFNGSYYYLNKVGGGVIIKGKRVNFHIVYAEDKIILGSPIIFGSY